MTATRISPVQNAELSPNEPAAASGPRQRRHFDSWTFVGRYGALILLAAIVVAAAILQPTTFATWNNISTILAGSAVTAIIAVGLTIPIVAGEFDLSIGYQASLAGIIGLTLMQAGAPFWLGLLAALATGLAAGGLNGLLVTRFGINALVATLGVGTVVLGVSYAITQGMPVVLRDPTALTWLSLQRFLGLPLPVWIAVLVAAVLWVGLNRTGLGMAVQAIGGNSEAARLSGVRVSALRTGTFMVAGLCAGLGGFIIATRTGSATVDAGNSYLMSSFAAVFFGSAVLSSGKFHIVGTLVGVVTVGIAFNIMAIAGFPTAYQFLFQGLLLILGVGVGTVSRRRASASSA